MALKGKIKLKNGKKRLETAKIKVINAIVMENITKIKFIETLAIKC